MIQPRSVTEKELAKVVSKIRESERALESMYCKVTDLERQLQASESIRPGVSALPVEILGMIFEEVVGQPDACGVYQLSPFTPDKPEWPVIRPELLISHVSKYWRAVAIGTSSLWTYIRLYVKQSVDLVNLYLTRSQGLPLVIAFRQHFVCGSCPRQTYATDHPRIIATILDYVHICRRLEICTSVPVPELVDGLSRSYAPLLKEIILRHPRSDMREHVFSSSSFPMLTHLELGQAMSISTSAMPAKTLTSLTLTGFPTFGLPATTFLALLSGLQSLSHLVLVDEVVDFDHPYATEAVVMPSLRSLTLNPGPDISRIYLTCLMEMVITPALEDLVFDFTNVSSPREIHLLLRHIKRQEPKFLSLRTVTINSRFEGSDIVDALVHAAPNIETLSLSRYSVTSTLMYLTHDARRGAFPRFHTLELQSPHFDWDAILCFLRKRKQQGKPLHCLRSRGFGGSEGQILNGIFEKLLAACLTI